MKITKQDVVEMLLTFSALYAKEYSKQQLDLAVNIWYERYKELDVNIFKHCYNQAISKSKMIPPTPAYIDEELDLLENADFIPNEIWENFIKKDLRVFNELGNMFNSDLILDSGHNQGFIAKEKARAYFDVIDTSLQIFFGNVDAIVELGLMPKENVVFERARYIKEAKNLKKQAETKQLVSDNNLKLANNDKKQLN